MSLQSTLPSPANVRAAVGRMALGEGFGVRHEFFQSLKQRRIVLIPAFPLNHTLGFSALFYSACNALHVQNSQHLAAAQWPIANRLDPKPLDQIGKFHRIGLRPAVCILPRGRLYPFGISSSVKYRVLISPMIQSRSARAAFCGATGNCSAVICSGKP